MGRRQVAWWLLLALPAYAGKIKPVKAGAVRVVDDREVEVHDTLQVTMDVPQLRGMADRAREAEVNAMLRRAPDHARDEVQGLADAPGAIDLAHPVPYEVDSTYEVTLATPRYVSLWQVVSRWTGDGNTWDERSGITIDLTRGAVVRLDEIFHPGVTWRPVVDATIRAAIIAHPDTWFADAAARFEGVTGSSTYTLSPEGVVVSFPYYTLAPSKSGFPEVVIPWARLDGLLADGLDLPPP